ncbi:CLIP-associating protein 2 isoform X11 [Pristis pectinata]|uniref:CLIP-associating protein 2 isoform X11 n=1 Tax=Pristis pectinata TaxID=685728 RepID=UPI00223DEFFE|nr:CLIP-associating protein 2 isoform X11 [Pristis pectinata]
MEPECGLEYFSEQVAQKDVGRRLQVGQELIDYLGDARRSGEVDHDHKRSLDGIVDELTGWVSSSNFKVTLLGLDVIAALVDRIKDRFKPHFGTLLPALVDRLGDTKDQVREQTQNLLLRIMDQAVSPQYVWERLTSGFKHKNFRTREGVCLCLITTLNTYGAQPLTLSKIVPHICNLLGDPNSQVRDTAMNTMVEIYRHVGEKVRADLSRKGVPQARLQILFGKFDDVLESGNMVLSYGHDKSFDDEESVDGSKPSASSTFKVSATKKMGSASIGGKRSASAPGSKAGTSKDGALDEDDFTRAFNDVPTVQIFSNRELEETLNKIREILSDDKHDWDQRANALKKIRSLLIAGAAEYDCFFQHLRLLEGAFKLSAKDLRSQVVREACITVAHLSTILGNKYDHSAEAIVPTLFNLVPNCAKVMATSGVAAIRCIIRHTHVPRLIPLITSNCTSKSVAVRRRCYEFLDLLLQEWQTHSLERHVTVLVETIKKGISDADAEARQEARKTYWSLRNHFPAEADALYNSLEPSYQKGFQAHLKSSTSAASLPHSDRSSSSSQESLNRAFPAKWSVASGSASKGPSAKSVATPGGLQRSRSDVDVNAAASAKSRHTAGHPGTSRLTASNVPAGAYSSLDDASDKADGRIRNRQLLLGTASGGGDAADSRGRSRTKVVSQSQRLTSSEDNKAASRSGSPGRVLSSTALSTMSIGAQRAIPTGAAGQKRSKIPRSQGCSREASPSRLSLVRGSRIPRPSVSQGCSRDASRESSRDTSPVRAFTPLASRHHSRSTGALYSSDTYSASAGSDRYGFNQTSKLSASVSAMRVLNTGSDVEEAVADALLLGDIRSKKKPTRKRYESYGIYSDDDANSDASSVCSERSYSSRNGSIPTYMRQTEDVAEVLNRCASTNFSERKEGLLGLQNLLKNQRTLSRVELKRLCEIFTRMFADPHSKVFSMFLETLVDFIHVHKEDLQDWLFVLLTQLLKKMGADLLGSVQAKVQKALDTARESFPNDLQFSILMRFTVDQTQTPNLKVKVAILKYIETLTIQMDPADFVNSSETRLAVSRIITWTTEPKSSDVRKAAQSVLICLFQLNTPEFSMLLGALPKTFQDGATKLLQTHLRSLGSTIQQGSGNSSVARSTPRSPAGWTSPLTSPTNTTQNTLPPSSAFNYDAENMNSEEIYCSLRGMTEAIQNFSLLSQEEMNEPLRRDAKKEEDMEQITAGVADARGGGDATDSGRVALDNKTSMLNTMSQRSSSRPRDYSPYNSTDSTSVSKSALKEAMFDDDADQFPDDASLDQSDLVAELLKELSNHNERIEERKAAMYELLKSIQEESLGVWDEHFKTVLLLLLETLGDREHTIRALALRVLKEILKHQPERFKNYAELTIIRTLEAHKDPQKEVVRAAEEAATALATSINPEQCIKVLCPIIQTAECPINLAAIKMQTKIIERVHKEVLNQLLPEIIPGLLMGYDNTESSVRKASVFCLVAIYSVIGEDLKPHLGQLTGSKMKLLNLYIKRAQTGSSTSGSASDLTGQS